jgi:hypothetical protein
MQTSAKRSRARKDPAGLTVQDPGRTGSSLGDGGGPNRECEQRTSRRHQDGAPLEMNIHRIIRPSTAYGTTYDPNATSEQDDEVAHAP